MILRLSRCGDSMGGAGVVFEGVGGDGGDGDGDGEFQDHCDSLPT